VGEVEVPGRWTRATSHAKNKSSAMHGPPSFPPAVPIPSRPDWRVKALDTLAIDERRIDSSARESRVEPTGV